ncbi:MAG: hypothetical protein HQK60_03310 [Deltaproteobacteria bacterium]|nr:hypothetical protein [Deltaproteobacteria bacterium]
MYRILRRFWSHDTGLTALLVLLFLDIFIFYPMMSNSLGRILVEACYILIIVFGVREVMETPVWGLLVIILGVTGLLGGVVVFIYPYRYLVLMNVIIEVAFIALLIVVILIRVFREGHVDTHRIAGAIAVYLLIGVLWGAIYSGLALMVPQAFNFAQTSPTEAIDPFDGRLLYFSFVTLTSVGYGDILPAHRAVKMIAVLEAVIGQLFPSILLARLVSMEIESRQTKKLRSVKEEAHTPS